MKICKAIRLSQQNCNSPGHYKKIGAYTEVKNAFGDQNHQEAQLPLSTHRNITRILSGHSRGYSLVFYFLGFAVWYLQVATTSAAWPNVCVVRSRGSWHIILRLWDSCWQSRFTVFSPFGFNSSFQADRYSIPSPPPQLHLLWYFAGLKTPAVKETPSEI